MTWIVLVASEKERRWDPQMTQISQMGFGFPLRSFASIAVESNEFKAAQGAKAS